MKNLYKRKMIYRFWQGTLTEEAETKDYEVGDIIYWPPHGSFDFYTIFLKM